MVAPRDSDQYWSAIVLGAVQTRNKRPPLPQRPYNAKRRDRSGGRGNRWSDILRVSQRLAVELGRELRFPMQLSIAFDWTEKSIDPFPNVWG